MGLWEEKRSFFHLEGPALAALSGGTDSSVLLAALVRANGPGGLLAATFDSPLHHPGELALARELTARLGVDHLVLAEDPLADPAFSANPKERCYLCKSRRLAVLGELARERGIALLLDGTNSDDTLAYRPGRQALKEAGVLTPLARAGLTKEMVRALGRELGLTRWLNPASACLATRVPYGLPLSPELLIRLRSAEEAVARGLGTALGSFRVRLHEDGLVRLELDPGRWAGLLDGDARAGLIRELKALGLNHVTLDLEGLRSGVWDRKLEDE